MTCQKLEETIKRLEGQAQDQKEDLNHIKSSCKQIVDTLDNLLFKEAPVIAPPTEVTYHGTYYTHLLLRGNVCK